MIGFMLHGNLPFSYANIVLSIVGFSMLVIIPSTKWEGSGETEEEKVKPIKLKNPRPAKFIVCVIVILYCSICGSLASYMTTIMESLGNSQEVSAYILSVYNLFALLGSLAFAVILRKVSESAVLAFNSISTLLVFTASVLINKTAFYFVGMAITGFFTGVLFSIIVAIATRIDYEHISLAGAYISMFGGIGDIITPVITSKLVSIYSVHVINKVVIILLVFMSLLSAVIYKITRKEA
jgi:fucose permease